MSREFTTREKALMLVLCGILLGIAYYKFVIQDVNETIAKYDTADLETELLVEQTKAEQILRMEAAMEEAKGKSGSFVASYNNIKNEISVLNDIFASADSYNFNFNQAVRTDDAVRREIDVAFTASSYSAAEAIIGQLHDCKYRCLIRNLSMYTNSGEGITSGSVSVSMNVTFFETMYHADTTDGLEESENESETTTEASSGETE